jgi:hypothetical protein
LAAYLGATRVALMGQKKADLLVAEMVQMKVDY